MKKFLAIMAAAALITSVFAAEPAANVGVAKFTGEASVTWELNLDTNKTGFKNVDKGEFEFTLFSKGDKATSSDADVWGEIKIEGGEVKNGASGSASVKDAKLHIGPAYIGILAGHTEVGGIDVISATSNKAITTGAVAAVEDHTQGITLGLDLDGVANFAVDFRSIGIANNYGLAAKVDVKAVENLTLVAGVSVDFDKISEIAAGVKAAYEMALTDVFYIKPQVGYTFNNGANAVAGGLLFGWNKAEDKDACVDTISGKVSNGVSAEVLFTQAKDAKKGKIALNAGIYDASFVENLACGVSLNVADIEAKPFAYTLGAGVKYTAAVGEGKIAPYAGLTIETNKIKIVKAGADFTGFVPFTTFTAAYATTDLDGKVKGTIDLSCKITF